MGGTMPSRDDRDGVPGGGDMDGTTAPTGRYVVTLSDDVFGDESAEAEALRAVTGASTVASTSDFSSGAVDIDQALSADAVLFTELGLAVVAADPARAATIGEAVARDPRTVAVEAEQILHALTRPVPPAGYLEGYRDAAEHLYQHFSGNGPPVDAPGDGVRFADTPTATWGLQATDVLSSQQSGSGIRVAVLDTGLDLDHPDFTGRSVTARSFVSGETAQDGQGHGTHCIGTACGPLRSPQPPGGRRYGVAHEADIVVGKVLSDEGSGSEVGILAGMNWAITAGCPVISMSLGAAVRAVSERYQKAGQRALARGSLVVAAAGNHADRANGEVGFVGVPANSPSIMAVGAVDPSLRVADFSVGTNRVQGGQIDLVAPGVDVYSSWPMPRRYHTISGTSMATPHVAGIAALWSQRTGATGEALWSQLVRHARRLPAPSVDVGAGLVRAPK